METGSDGMSIQSAIYRRVAVEKTVICCNKRLSLAVECSGVFFYGAASHKMP